MIASAGFYSCRPATPVSRVEEQTAWVVLVRGSSSSVLGQSQCQHRCGSRPRNPAARASVRPACGTCRQCLWGRTVPADDRLCKPGSTGDSRWERPENL